MLDNNIMDLFGKEFKNDVKVSRISEDIRGKAIVIYGGNNLGKSLQASRLPNPVFMPCEKGLNAINGAMVLKTTCWADLERNGRKLTSRNFVEALDKGAQITLIIDGFENIGKYCKAMLCQKYKVPTIGKANDGFGCWEEYENLVWGFVDNLLGVGYTVVFIGHESWDGKKKKFLISGDERNIKPIRDNADIVCYLESNGLDEAGKPIHSSAYLAESKDFFARTRFSYMDTYIEDFTAENLVSTIVEGIKRQNKAEGFDNVDFKEQQDIYKEEKVNFKDVIEIIKGQYEQLLDKDDDSHALEDFFLDTVEKYLGDIPVSEATETQLESLICIKNNLEEKLETI
jgi:hypothetical protein